MTTTTTKRASSKDSSSLSSSDLVSRFLAATPSYLYNVPPIQQNFFFSEMLRSFLPLKNDAGLSNNSFVRRRKRSWRDSSDRPLELTTNKKKDCHYHSATQTSILQYQHHHHPQNSQLQQYPILLQNYQHSFERQLQNSIADPETRIDNNLILDNQTNDNFDKQELSNLIGIQDTEIEKKNKFIKKYYLERLPLNSPSDPDIDNIKTDQSQNIRCKTNDIDDNMLQYKPKLVENTVCYSKKKSEFNTKNICSKTPGSSKDTYTIPNCRLPNNETSDFPQSSLWHPQYSLSQTQPTVDPFHFFIDLRVSGHIWNQNTSENNIFSRSKHSSAFNVPQSKEYIRPLNLTRSESSSTLIKSLNKRAMGTHHIFRNIKQTYQRIWDTENLRNDTSNGNFNGVIPLQQTQIVSLKTDKINGISHKQKEI